MRFRTKRREGLQMLGFATESSGDDLEQVALVLAGREVLQMRALVALQPKLHE
jgi:hypothetical protein